MIWAAIGPTAFIRHSSCTGMHSAIMRVTGTYIPDKIWIYSMAYLAEISKF